MNLFARQEYRHRCRKRLCGQWEEGESGINWEIRINLYTPPCVKQIASGTVLDSTRSSAQCSVRTQRGRMGGGGSEAQEGGNICTIQLIYAVAQQKPTQHCKAIILQLKNNDKYYRTAYFQKRQRQHYSGLKKTEGTWNSPHLPIHPSLKISKQHNRKFPKGDDH